MAKVVIDAGHGGEDSGAIGNGIIEKDLNLKISKYIYERLKKLGVDVKITRDKDETLTPTERVNRVLNAFGNSNDVIVISNHINAGGGDGAEVIYALRNNETLSNLILNELSKEGQNIRRAYQRRLPSDYKKDYYFMQRNTGNTESITIEYGFLDGNGDDVSQLKNNWQKYAEAVVKALIKYLNLEYIPDMNEDYYIVKAGDTLWSIAKRFNTSVDNIKRINNLSSSMLKIGQKLIIDQVENDKQKNIYIVQKGDTLYKIANNYGVTVSNLVKENNLMNTNLSIGQILEIPIEKISNKKTYTVKAGDTLYKISRENNISIDDLIKNNNLTSNLLSIGQILKLK